MKNLVLLIAMFTYFYTSVYGNDYFFEEISPKSGFAFDAIYTITEDCNGQIWFGGNSGLYYYNTHQVEKILFYPNNSSTPQAIKINIVYTDKDCRLWICSELGLYTIKNNHNEITQVHFNTSTLKTQTQNVTGILQKDSTTFMVVIDETLFAYDTQTDSFTEIKSINYDIRKRVSFIGEGQKDQYLIGTKEGLILIGNKTTDADLSLLYNATKSTVRTVSVEDNKYFIGYDGAGINSLNNKGELLEIYSEEAHGRNYLPSNRVRQILKRPNGEYWFGTYNGIAIVSQDSNTILKKNDANGLPYNSIYTIYQGINNDIWIGTWAGGLAYYNDFNYRFKHFKNAGEIKHGDQSIISSFTEVENGNIWIGSEDGGLAIYNPNDQSFENNLVNKKIDHLSRIKSLSADSNENIWIGTFNKGLWQYNLKTNTIRQIKGSILNSETIISSTLVVDDELWIGTRNNGLFCYNMITAEIKAHDFSKLFPEEAIANRIWGIIKDSDDDIWLSTDTGLFLKSKGKSGFIKCFDQNAPFNLNNNIIFTLFEDANGLIWLGTKGKGIFKYNKESKLITPFIHNDQILTADVYSILSNDNQEVWFSTNMGIFLYNMNSEKLQQFSSIDGLSGNQYNPNAGFCSSEGNLYFGSPNGFNIINPSLIKINPIPPKVVLAKVLVNHRNYELVEGSKNNPYYLSNISHLNLKHDQNSLTFGFASNCFIKPSKNRFRYRLVNYMDDWTTIAHGQNVTFTKLPHGKYTLEVIGSNNDNLWSSHPISLRISVSPPLWLTWYAYLTYISFFLGVIYLFLKQFNLRLQLRREIMKEKLINEANEILHEEKIKFFTNISHELRTPLTLIISPLNSLLTKLQNDQSSSKQLKVIKRNADRLLRLTKQILDFRLLELNKIRINTRKSDVVAIATNVINCFEFQIIEKKINFIFSSDYKAFWMNIDPEMLEKIIYNLLSNAFKFSHDKGQILFSIEKKTLNRESYKDQLYVGDHFEGESLEIKIRDFGIGISSEVLPDIFERFSKAPDSNETGSGIGLHLCLEYAKLNKSNIFATSAPADGSTFTLNIPITISNENKKESIVTQPHFDRVQLEDNHQDDDIYHNGNNKKVMLIVEDNDDLRIYLKTFLSKYYKVLTAKNGTQALEIANEVIPNMIITDILIPGIDGIELTKRIKNNPSTSFIPIIILTALSEGKYQMQGLLTGADSFLLKPIDESILLAQIQNIIKNRLSLKRVFDQAAENPNSIASGSSQLSFIEQAEQIVLSHLQKHDFNVSDLASQLNVSHSSLHRKIKTFTNQSPTEFVRDIRLKKAIMLMKDNKYNIDEISTYVGFNSTSYFMRSFKKKYGTTPKEYRRRIQDTD